MNPLLTIIKGFLGLFGAVIFILIIIVMKIIEKIRLSILRRYKATITAHWFRYPIKLKKR